MHVNLNLPNANSRIGIFVSGGLDSAILYHILLLERTDVVPLMVFKNNEQYNIARKVISHIQHLHNIHVEPLLLKHRDIKAAIKEAIALGFDLVYLGVIKELEEFLIDWQPNNFKDTQWARGPLKDLDKKDIVSLIVQHKMDHLFLITHSCASQSSGRCNTCNRCRERHWGFEKLGLTDPGNL